MDNMYDFACSGHVDESESCTKAVIREAKEELGIVIQEKDLIFLAVNHDYQQHHFQLFFSTKSYENEPIVGEPDQCGGLLWADINQLPDNIIPYVKNVLFEILSNIQYDDSDFQNLKR